MKADLKTKLILSYSNTSANIHDSQVFEELLDGGKTKPCWPTAPITAPITAPSMKMCLIKAQRAGVPDAQSHTLPIP